MKVVVRKVSIDDLWYEDEIGNVFYVYETEEYPTHYVIPLPFGHWSKFFNCLFLIKKDCEVLE